MAGKRVEHWQAGKVKEAVGPMVGYLYRLLRRMEKVGFGRADRLYDLATQAYDALHALSVETHYLSCKGGVGRPANEDAGEKEQERSQ
jgi:hypothetical protein